MTESRKRILRVLFYIGLLSTAAFLLYLPSELGAALTIPPDSSEYSICLANLFEHGRFGFTLNGEWYPSRYAPWFSLSCLTPAYFLGAGNVLCMHWAILAFALVLLGAIWRIGSMLGLGKLAALPPILLMFMPDFVFYSRVVMTEIPYAALFVILALVFVRFVNREQITVMSCLGIGSLVAWSGLVRSTGFALIVPFAVVVFFKRLTLKRKIALIVTMVVPIAIAEVISLAYNWMVFGSPFRSGYNYWMPVPCDFPSLMFSWDYVVRALGYFYKQLIIRITLLFIGASLAVALYFMGKRFWGKWKDFLFLEVFVVFHALVLLVLYLGYYWVDTRFFLSITIVAVPLFFAAVNGFLSGVASRLRLLLMVLIALLSFLAIANAPSRYTYMLVGRPVWLCEAQISGKVLPSGSVVLQKGDSNVLDYFGLRSKNLIVFHKNRRCFDYVSQMTAPKRITNLVETPKSILPLVIPKLVDSGVCGMPFPVVFDERPEKVGEYISQGRRVFFLQDMFFREEYEEFKESVENMGFTLKLFGVWNVPEVAPNPIRHLYDRLLFPGYSMDSRPEITVAYYEVVPVDKLPTSP